MQFRLVHYSYMYCCTQLLSAVLIVCIHIITFFRQFLLAAYIFSPSFGRFDWLQIVENLLTKLSLYHRTLKKLQQINIDISITEHLSFLYKICCNKYHLMYVRSEMSAAVAVHDISPCHVSEIGLQSPPKYVHRQPFLYLGFPQRFTLLQIFKK